MTGRNKTGHFCSRHLNFLFQKHFNRELKHRHLVVTDRFTMRVWINTPIANPKRGEGEILHVFNQILFPSK